MIYKNKDETKKASQSDKRNDIEETLTNVSDNIKKESKKEATKIGDSDHE